MGRYRTHVLLMHHAYTYTLYTSGADRAGDWPTLASFLQSEPGDGVGYQKGDDRLNGVPGCGMACTWRKPCRRIMQGFFVRREDERLIADRESSSS